MSKNTDVRKQKFVDTRIKFPCDINANPLPRAYMLEVRVFAFYTIKTITESILSHIFEFLMKNYPIQRMGGVICLLGPGDL